MGIWWDSSEIRCPPMPGCPQGHSTFCPHFTPSVGGKDLSSFSVCVPVVRRASPVALAGRNPPAMQEPWFDSWVREVPEG